MKNLALTGVLFFLFGCATPPKDMNGPDGSPHKLLTCYEIEDCYEEAGQVCGKYKIVNTSSHTDSGDNPRSFSKMLVKCED